MAEKSYAHRDVVDKLGIRPGHVVMLDETEGPLPEHLRARVVDRTGRVPAVEGELFDVALVAATASTEAEGLLRRWKERLDPAGGIWLLTPKRGSAGYVDQTELIAAGKAAGLVDNKVCSVDERTSAMRFVYRKANRPSPLVAPGIESHPRRATGPTRRD